MPVQCQVCSHENPAWVEGIAEQAVRGEISWREVSRRTGNLNAQAVKRHMEAHRVTDLDAAQFEADSMVADVVRGLKEKMAALPPEAAALYAVVITNLANLHKTKPSQQNLISALKTAAEITGMRLEQQLLLQFAQASFGVLPEAAVAALPAPSSPEMLEIMAEEVYIDG